MDIAKLGFQVESSAIKAATEDLNELAAAAERAAAALAKLPPGVKVVANADRDDSTPWDPGRLAIMR